MPASPSPATDTTRSPDRKANGDFQVPTRVIPADAVRCGAGGGRHPSAMVISSFADPSKEGPQYVWWKDAHSTLKVGFSPAPCWKSGRCLTDSGTGNGAFPPPLWWVTCRPARATRAHHASMRLHSAYTWPAVLLALPWSRRHHNIGKIVSRAQTRDTSLARVSDQYLVSSSPSRLAQGYPARLFIRVLSPCDLMLSLSNTR